LGDDPLLKLEGLKNPNFVTQFRSNFAGALLQNGARYCQSKTDY